LKKISHHAYRFFEQERADAGESVLSTQRIHTHHIKKQNNVCFCRSRSKQRRRRWWSKGERREFLSLVESLRGEKRAVFWDFFLRNLPPFFFLSDRVTFLLFMKGRRRGRRSLSSSDERLRVERVLF